MKLLPCLLFCLGSFLLTSSGLVAQDISAELPKEPEAVPAVTAPTASIKVLSDGQILLNDKPIKIEDLTPSLEKSYRDRPDLEVNIAAESSASQSVVKQVTSSVQKAGIKRVTVGTGPAKPKAEDGKPKINEADSTANSLSVTLSPKQVEALRKELEKKRRTEAEIAKERKMLERTPNLHNKNKTLKNRLSIPKRF